VPNLMERLKNPYYVGLLSAAQYHGAAHHHPQEFQVVTETNRRLLECGGVRVVFIAAKRLKQVGTQTFNTPRGIGQCCFHACGVDTKHRSRIAGQGGSQCAPALAATIRLSTGSDWRGGQDGGTSGSRLKVRKELHSPIIPSRTTDNRPYREVESPGQNGIGRRGSRVFPQDYITEWQTVAPWINDEQVEQDLVISRARSRSTRIRS
jgi:hypothetical protein